MENKIRIVSTVMSLMVILSAMFYIIALKGVLSFGMGIVVFILAMMIWGFIRGKKGVDEREMYLNISMQLFALLAGVSFILIYLGISLMTGTQPNNLLEYALFVYILSLIPPDGNTRNSSSF